MKVKAIADGYYNNRRVKAGQVFALADDGDFSKRWMEKDDSDQDVTVSAAKQRPARVQQAPDARDVSRTIDETLKPEDKVEFSQGQQIITKPRSLAAVEADEESEGEDGAPKKRGRHARRGKRGALKRLLHKDSDDSSKKEVI
jgi:hypothetical protein